MNISMGFIYSTETGLTLNHWFDIDLQKISMESIYSHRDILRKYLFIFIFIIISINMTHYTSHHSTAHAYVRQWCATIISRNSLQVERINAGSLHFLFN